MDEARQVLERLASIERLRASAAPPGVLLGEVRALLADGERWLASERPEGLDEARAALDRLRTQLNQEVAAAPIGKEEVVARAAL